MTKKREVGFTFHPDPNEGQSLALYGVPARDLDTADVAALSDEQYALVLRETAMYRPVDDKPAKPPKEE